MIHDLYHILGVPRGASRREIKTRYRALYELHQENPKQVPNLDEISEAYNVLVDDDSREHYNQTGQPPGQDKKVARANVERLMRDTVGLIKQGHHIGDIVDYMRSQIEQAKSQALNVMRNRQVELDHLEMAVGRVAGTEAFDSLLKTDIESTKKSMEDCVRLSKMHDDMLFELSNLEDKAGN